MQEILIEKNKGSTPYTKTLIITTVVSCALYGAVPFFHSDKDLGHPSGFLQEKKSPDYEMVVAFEMVTQAVGLWG